MTTQTPATPPLRAPAPHRSERLMAIAAGLLAICAIGVALGLSGLSRNHDAVMQEVTRTRATRLATNGLIQSSIDAETGQRGYLLTADAQFLEPFESGRTAALMHLGHLEDLTATDPTLAAQVERTGSLARQAFASMAEPIEGRLAERRLRESLRISKSQMDALRSEVAGLLQEVERRVDSAREREREGTEALYRIGGILALLTLLAVALTAWVLRSERKSWRAAIEALTEANTVAEEARASAHASDLAKTRFLAVASHDMRQPLHALTLYLSALERRVEGAEARDIIAKMDRATQSMVGMFSTLLDLARIQAGVVKPELEVVRVQDVIERIVAEHPGSKIEATRTRLTVHTDPLLLERMLRNLVSNALKHGGGNARISVTSAGAEVEIAVADDGPGIALEDQERIFEEFVRLEGRTEGLGLGLAIVKRIADLMAMPLELVSSPGAGAQFILRAPAARSAAAPATCNADQAQFNGAAVLVVDDDALAREAVTRMLRDLGAEVRSGANEAEAEAVLDEAFAPRLLVMDLRIEGSLAGIEIARRLAARIAPRPGVIVITGDTGPETMAMLRASGFPWMIKPVDPGDLSEAAAAALRAA